LRGRGSQLWTVKDELQRDFAGTLRRIAGIGLRRVELYELGGRPAAEIRAGIDAAGLECLSAHVRFWELDADFSGNVERAHQIGLATWWCRWPMLGARHRIDARPTRILLLRTIVAGVIFMDNFK
jgi:hypothetical protein